MKTHVFAMISLTITFGMTSLYSALKSHFNRPEIYTAKIQALRQEVEKEKFRHLVTSYDFHDFRQYVATLLPDAIQQKGEGEKSYQLRSLASVVQRPDQQNSMKLRGNELFAQAAKQYSAKEYAATIKTLETLQQKYPYFERMPESMLLLLDCYYKIQLYEDAIATYEKMLSLYPELDVTGYAMLTVGQIYEHFNKHDQAIEIYQTIVKSFRNPELVTLGNLALRKVEL